MSDDVQPVDRERLIAAIRESWSTATAAGDAPWSPDNPSRGQCDVTSLVVLEYLGGDLQLAEVRVDGERTEYHYWNLLADEVLDLTRGQFRDGEEIVELARHPHDFIRTNYGQSKGDVRHRHEILRSAVIERLGHPPRAPLV